MALYVPGIQAIAGMPYLKKTADLFVLILLLSTITVLLVRAGAQLTSAGARPQSPAVYNR
ncbi:MAG: hypothetical protein HYS04_03490 [Acidobacteria bacterium]|nr:hypothetical protein [Acidobacteriota bacterium]